MYSGLRGERRKKGARKGHSAPKVADPIESRGHWGHGRTRLSREVGRAAQAAVRQGNPGVGRVETAEQGRWARPLGRTWTIILPRVEDTSYFGPKHSLFLFL